MTFGESNTFLVVSDPNEQPSTIRFHEGEFRDQNALAAELSHEFHAPVSVIERGRLRWCGHSHGPLPGLPSTEACLAATVAVSGPRLDQTALLRPDPPDSELPTWLVIPIAITPAIPAQYLVVVGFATWIGPSSPGLPEPKSSEPLTPGASGGDQIIWGPPCPDPALRAWGEAVALRMTESSALEIPAAMSTREDFQQVAMDEVLPLLEQFAQRLRISDSSRNYQRDVSTRLRDALNVGVIAWVPRNPRHDPIVVGDLQGEPACAETVRRIVDTLPSEIKVYAGTDPDGVHFVAATADTEHGLGWLLALGPKDRMPLTVERGVVLATAASLISAQQSNARTYLEMKDLLIGVFRALTSAIDAKDPYTAGHSERVARIASRLGVELGMSSTERGDLYLMGLLHDIGKIGIDDQVLKKRGPLDDEEFQHIQQHVRIGVEILKDLKKLSHLLPGVEGHHESLDGSGYPNGLIGEEIPWPARILAVADSYDAMASNRPYRRRLSTERLQQIFRDGAGKQWDRRVVEALFSCFHEIEAIQNRGQGTGRSLVSHVDNTMGREQVAPELRGERSGKEPGSSYRNFFGRGR